MEAHIHDATMELRDFMFERVYNFTNKSMQEKSERMLTQMFEYFSSHEKELPEPYFRLLETYPKEQVVCDYISGMTDRYAVSIMKSLFIPENF